MRQISAQAAERSTTQMRAATLAAGWSGIEVSRIRFRFAPVSSSRWLKRGEVARI
jgi:hypothetical protein